MLYIIALEYRHVSHYDAKLCYKGHVAIYCVLLYSRSKLMLCHGKVSYNNTCYMFFISNIMLHDAILSYIMFDPIILHYLI